MLNHLPEAGRMRFVLSQYRAVRSVIGEELRARYQPSNQLSHELCRLLRQIRCSSNIRRSGSRSRRSHEMWLCDDEPRRMAEISLHVLTD
jgi:hypothetical protein